MKYFAEYRDPATARLLIDRIAGTVTQHWTLMEVSGGQTHAVLKHGLDRLLPEEVELVHGPGCPVCVTPLEAIDEAIAIARQPDTILCSFGEMLRVPGSKTDLLAAKSLGADVRPVYSPLDALALALRHPERQVVFFAVGFETSAPSTAMAAFQARRRQVANFSLLVSHMRVPPVMEALLGATGNRVQAFLAAGHVCTVMGMEEYHGIAARHRVPIVATGFEPVDILAGVLACLRQLEQQRFQVENGYRRSVRPEGNPAAKAMLEQVLMVADRPWRGLGPIADGGFALRREYADLDAERRFNVETVGGLEPSECRAGQVLQGALKPDRCPAYGTRCTPDHPLGAPMVSSEGACAAYFRYRGAVGQDGGIA